MTGGEARSEAGRALDVFRQELILTLEDLWVRYLGLGGAADIENFRRYLAGGPELGRGEHNTIAQALNERYLDAGADHPVPYLD